MSNIAGKRFGGQTYPGSSALRGSTPMQVFTPAFQSANSDASLGSTGQASATFWKSGPVLNVQGFFIFAGTGVTAGSGGLLLPFPPGFSASDIDASRMPILGDIPGPPHIIEAQIQVPASGELGAGPTIGGFESFFLLETSDGTVAEATWEFDLLVSDVQDGNRVFFSYSLPLK